MIRNIFTKFKNLIFGFITFVFIVSLFSVKNEDNNNKYNKKFANSLPYGYHSAPHINEIRFYYIPERIVYASGFNSTISTMTSFSVSNLDYDSLL